MRLAEPPVRLERKPLPQLNVREYDRVFNWQYLSDTAPPPGASAPAIPISWGGLPVNIGDLDNGATLIIEDVQGWLDSPPLAGNDVARAVADGAAWGPKVLGPRVVTLQGVVMGPRDVIGAIRDLLAGLAVSRDPADLSVTDSGIGRTLTASVRADSDSWKLAWLGPLAFRWTVVLTAVDPLLYGDWQQVTLTAGPGVQTGRVYQRTFSWQYGAPSLGNSAQLANDGNVAAPVLALYTGDLTTPILSDDFGESINLASLAAGLQVQVDTSNLIAIGPGGLSRASYVLPGSDVMTLPPGQTATWDLATQGGGNVVLSWRSAWA